MNPLEDYLQNTRHLMRMVDASGFAGKFFQYLLTVNDLTPEGKVNRLESMLVTIPADIPLRDALGVIERQYESAYERKFMSQVQMQISFLEMADDNGSLDYNQPTGYLFPHGSNIIVHAEIQNLIQIDALKDSEKIPVLLITGFLGSGKTTLMNSILTGNHGKKFAVIQNEFGSVDIDGKLVQEQMTTKEDILTLDNGCMCCTVRGDLIKALNQIVTKFNQADSIMDAILIETTGMADPEPILAVFSDKTAVGDVMRLDSVLTVVDTKRIAEQLDRKVDDGVNEAVQQVIFADRILLNKADTVTTDVMKSTRKKIRSINKFCQMHPTTFSKIDISKILEQQSHSLEKLGELGDKLLETPDEEDEHDHEHGHGDGHGHDPNCKHHSHGHGHEEKEGHGHGHGHGKKAHGHGHKEHGHGHKEHGHGHKKHGHGHKEHGHGHNHKKQKVEETRHSSGVSSIGLSKEGEIEMRRLQQFIQGLLKTKLKDLYRYKGIYAIKGNPKKFVIQGVHESVQFDSLSDWKPEETKKCTMVFIGKDLEKEKLEAAFNKCFEAPEAGEKRSLEEPEDPDLSKRQKIEMLDTVDLL